jgi:hypothetical protein
VGVLVPLIALFPREHRTSAEVREIAGRLADLLPMQRFAAPPAVAPNAGQRRLRLPANWPLWLALGAVLVSIAARGLLH